MNILKAPRILYFVNGSAPTRDDLLAAAKIGPGVVFRNARLVPTMAHPDSLEKTDGVAGNIPPAYAHIARGDDVWKKWQAGIEAHVHNVVHPAPANAAPIPPAVKAVQPAAMSRPAIDFAAQPPSAAPAAPPAAPAVPDSPAVPAAPVAPVAPPADPAPTPQAAPENGWSANPPTAQPPTS